MRWCIDAVRPLGTAEISEEVNAAAKTYGAAIAGLPAVDTVKQVERTADGAIIKPPIPRAGVVLSAQTPQGFHYSVTVKSFRRSRRQMGFMRNPTRLCWQSDRDIRSQLSAARREE